MVKVKEIREFAFLLLLTGYRLSLFSQTETGTPLIGNGLTMLQQIQGDWTCVYSSYPPIWASCPQYECNDNIRIKDSVISEFDFPCEYHFSSILWANGNQGMGFIPPRSYQTEMLYVKLAHDTLQIYNHDPWAIRRYYVRDTLENGLINKLMVDSINQECLYGTWYLKKNTKLKKIKFIFPFSVPDSITITRLNVHTFYNKGRFFELCSKRHIRRFTITTLSLKSNKFEIKPTFKYKKIQVDYRKGDYAPETAEYYKNKDD